MQEPFDDITLHAIITAAGMTPQARGRRMLMGRFKVGGPRVPPSDGWAPRTRNTVDPRRFLLEDDHDGSWTGLLSSRSRQGS